MLPQVERFLKQWKLTGVEKRETCRRAYEAPKAVGDVAGSFAFNFKMLQLYNMGDTRGARRGARRCG